MKYKYIINNIYIYLYVYNIICFVTKTVEEKNNFNY